MGENSTALTADVTVIVPVRDCAPYLVQCLDSILGQTLPPRQVVCVDDGSVDGSSAILDRFARENACVEVLHLDGVGPGAARNRGFERATGAYTLFVDADDFIEPSLLELACKQADEQESDIVVWDIWFFNDRFGHRQYPSEGTFCFGKLDNGSVFSWKNNPDWLFLSFQSWAWNKLFRTSFLRNEGIRFQESVTRSEDVPFTCMALAAAKRISCIYDRLSNYRVARAGSAMATKDAHALEFFDAFLCLREELEKRNLYDALRRGFANFAFSSCLYNLQTVKSQEAMEKVYRFLKDEGFKKLGIDGNEEELWLNDGWREEWNRITDMNFGAYAFYRMQVLANALDDATAVGDHVAMDLRAEIDERDATIVLKDRELEERDETIRLRDTAIEELNGVIADRDRTIAEKEAFIQEILGCAEWKVGSALCAAPRAVQRKILAAKEEKKGLREA